jgi:hypothetical protein
MSHSSRIKPALFDPSLVTLADTLTPSDSSRPDVKSGGPPPFGLEPMLSIEDLAALLNCSRRLVERMRSAGKVPKPDLRIGKMPRWKPETIRRWIDGGGQT